MGGHKTISCSSPIKSEFIPPLPPYVYEIVGVVSPDVTGGYREDGIFGFEMSYANDDRSWFIWRHVVTHSWRISPVKGDVAPPSWISLAVDVADDYLPYPPATGFPTVRIYVP